MYRPQGARRRRFVRGVLTAAALFTAAACVPDGGSGTPPTTSTTVPTNPNAVTGVQLSWSYSQYAQYGVFGPWSQKVSGPNVSVNIADGQEVTGLAAESGRTYTQAQFDNGTGTIDPVTGAGTVTWDSGDWVLNAYNGLYGAPDETLSDPILTIAGDGSGTLSFEATIPPGLDISGNPAPGAGPSRITVATFDDVDSLVGTSMKVTPDFAGRSYTHPLGYISSQDCGGIGGSWPAEWIDFVPDSVKLHYFTTSCSGLNLRKPPTPFEVKWGTAAAEISAQPTLSGSSILAGDTLAPLGARIGVRGTPTPGVQWQSSPDGISWADVPGVTSTRFDAPLAADLSGCRFRALVGGSIASDVIGPVDITAIEANVTYITPDLQVGLGERNGALAAVEGAPKPTVVWERSDDGGASWSPIDSARHTTELVPLGGGSYNAAVFIKAAQLSDDGAQYRARVSNGIGGEKVSGISTVEVINEVPQFSTQPLSSGGFAGGSARFYAEYYGTPQPTGFRWQHSTDEGATWSDVLPESDQKDPNELFIDGSEVTADRNGELFRAAATNAAGTAYSDTAELVVLERTGTRRVVLISPQQLDPAKEFSVTAVAEGFQLPEGSTASIEFSLRDAANWQVGQPLPTDQPFGGSTFSAADLQASGGLLSGSFWVASGSLAQGHTYGLVTGSTDPADRSYDTWTPIEVVWVTP